MYRFHLQILYHFDPQVCKSVSFRANNGIQVMIKFRQSLNLLVTKPCRSISFDDPQQKQQLALENK